MNMKRLIDKLQQIEDELHMGSTIQGARDLRALMESLTTEGIDIKIKFIREME